MVSRRVWGVSGISKPYYGLFLICARWRAGVPPYVKPYYGLVKLCYGLVIRGPARRGEHAGGLKFGAGGPQVGEKCAFGQDWAYARCARGFGA